MLNINELHFPLPLSSPSFSILAVPAEAYREVTLVPRQFYLAALYGGFDCAARFVGVGAVVITALAQPAEKLGEIVCDVLVGESRRTKTPDARRIYYVSAKIQRKHFRKCCSMFAIEARHRNLARPEVETGIHCINERRFSRAGAT